MFCVIVIINIPLVVTNTLSSFKYNAGKCIAVEEGRYHTSNLLSAAVTLTSLALGADQLQELT